MRVLRLRVVLGLLGLCGVGLLGQVAQAVVLHRLTIMVTLFLVTEVRSLTSRMYSMPILRNFFSLILLGLGQISSNEGTMKVPLSTSIVSLSWLLRIS